MILCLSKSHLDAFYYENSLNLRTEKGKFINFKHKNSIDRVNMVDIVNSKIIICLNSFPIEEFKKLSSLLIKTKRKPLVFYSNQTTFKTGVEYKKFNYLDVRKIADIITPITLEECEVDSFIKMPASVLNVLQETEYYKNVSEIIYTKKDYSYDKKYKFKNSEYCYVPKEKYELFSLNFQKAFFYKIKGTRSKQTQLKVIQSIHKKIKDFGVDESVIDQTNLIIRDTLRSIKKKNSNVYSHFMESFDREDFVTEHSLMTAYLSVAILEKLNLFQSNVKIKEKMIFASLFHDLDISNDYQDLEMNENIDDSDEEFRSHPIRSMTFIDSLVNDEDLKKIIMYHHELPNGEGLFKIKGKDTPILSSLFNTSHFFCCQFFKGLSKKEILESMKENGFDNYNYSRFFNALVELNS